MSLPNNRAVLLAAAASVLLVAGFALALFWAPEDADQGFSQRIFYIHVPLALTAYACFGWGAWKALRLLWTRESGWRADAYNASSGAYGIPQSLPGSKMASAGADWRTSAATQINWGLGYIDGRYGSPCAAWAHSEAVNWY